MYGSISLDPTDDQYARCSTYCLLRLRHICPGTTNHLKVKSYIVHGLRIQRKNMQSPFCSWKVPRMYQLQKLQNMMAWMITTFIAPWILDFVFGCIPQPFGTKRALEPYTESLHSTSEIPFKVVRFLYHPLQFFLPITCVFCYQLDNFTITKWKTEDFLQENCTLINENDPRW